MQVVVDAVQINRGIRGPGHREILGSEVIFSEQVVQLELAGVATFTHSSFFGSEGG